MDKKDPYDFEALRKLVEQDAIRRLNNMSQGMHPMQNLAAQQQWPPLSSELSGVFEGQPWHSPWYSNLEAHLSVGVPLVPIPEVPKPTFRERLRAFWQAVKVLACEEARHED